MSQIKPHSLGAIAIISLSSNTDMAQYLQSKIATFSHNKFIFYTSEECLEKNNITRENLKTITKYGSNKISKRSFGDLLLALRSAIMISKIRPRAIIFDNENYLNIPMACVFKFFGIPTVFSVHDIEPHPGKMSTVFRIYNYISRKFLASGFISFSQQAKDILEKSRPTELNSLVRLDTIDTINVPGSYFLWFGRVEPYKGLGELLKIINLSRAQGLDAKFVVAGAGTDEAIAALKLVPNVDVMNRFIPEEELNSLISRAIAVLLPYTSATQSGVITKAYSCRVPVVAFDVGSFSESIVPNCTGYIAPRESTQRFLDALEKCLENEKYLKNWIYTHFTQDHLVSLSTSNEERILALVENLRP